MYGSVFHALDLDLVSLFGESDLRSWSTLLRKILIYIMHSVCDFVNMSGGKARALYGGWGHVGEGGGSNAS